MRRQLRDADSLVAACHSAEVEDSSVRCPALSGWLVCAVRRGTAWTVRLLLVTAAGEPCESFARVRGIRAGRCRLVLAGSGA